MMDFFNNSEDEEEYHVSSSGGTVQRGVPQDKLKQIPTSTIKKTDKENVCAICLKNFERGKKVMNLPCKHMFHVECISTWFKQNHVCPNCRYDLRKST